MYWQLITTSFHALEILSQDNGYMMLYYHKLTIGIYYRISIKCRTFRMTQYIVF